MNDAVTCLAKEYLETDGKSKAAKRPCLIVFFREPLKIAFTAPGILPPAALVHPSTSHVGWVKPRKRRTQQNHNGLCHPTLKGDTLYCAGCMNAGRFRHPASRDTCTSLCVASAGIRMSGRFLLCVLKRPRMDFFNNLHSQPANAAFTASGTATALIRVSSSDTSQQIRAFRYLRP